MQLRSLKINGFRNLMPLELSLPPESNILAFVGKNGQGKTNLLEAIYLCALSKSFRTEKNQELVAFDQDFCRIQAFTSEQELEFFVSKTPPRKALKINGVKKSAVEFIGSLKTVFFSPDDLAYMAFAPRLRRRYLDILLSQFDPDYLQALIQYEEARKQRNALLKRIKNEEAQREELEFWNELLAKHAPIILTHRRESIEALNPLVQHYYQAISQSLADLKIEYLSEVQDFSASEYLATLQKHLESDLASGNTSIGPQRDDLIFHLESQDMKAFASRGEWRSLVLALKFAEIELLKQKTGDHPLLLLDDVFSELDEGRQKFLLETIGETQTFITTTHGEFFETLKLPCQLYQVEHGQIK